MDMNCEMLDIRIFLAIIDFGGFQRAAEVLKLSQPTLTRRIQGLENHFGTTLFNRTTRQVTLTRIGREVEVHFRRIAREFEDCVFSLTDFGVKPSGIITISCLPTMSTFFLPQVLRIFHEKYPDIRFRIRDASAVAGVDAVARGEAEFGISSSGGSRPDLLFTPFTDEPFALACRADDPIAGEKSLRWADIRNLPLVISVRSNNRLLIDQALSRLNLSLDWAFQTAHLSTTLGLVEAGLGMAVLPLLSLSQNDRSTIRIIPLEDPVIKRTIGFLETRDRQRSRTAEELKEIIRAYANEASLQFP